jgi:hypothetical protein
MSTHTGRLLLSTGDPFLAPEQALLTARLSDAGFLGPPLSGQIGAFSIGERFLQLLTFAGCAVKIAQAPDGDVPFCHIRLTGPFERPRFQCGRNTRPPRCPSCRSPLVDWKMRLANGKEADSAAIACPTCGETSPPWAYDWKQKAGFGRLFIRIEEVFPGEAVPTPELMNLLQSSAGCNWRYFYLQDDGPL